IPLDKKLTDEIIIEDDHVPRFTAKLGQTNIKKAVKITESIYESNE
ncbi:MAG: FliM/FliN family flagellar motor switch protein, partial [Ruminococcus sp.]|nr:FliM/FliN family flagellar motor switch protein [Ruminococcus sp.]